MESNFMTISPAQAARLAAVRLKQDHNAHAFGVLEWEFEKELARLVREGAGAPDKLALGALYWEYLEKRKFFLAAVARVEAEQRAAGEGVLREFGLDPAADDYAIQDGHVLRLRGGRWLPVPRPTIN